MSRIWFAKGLRGMLAKRIQSDLLRAGFSAARSTGSSTATSAATPRRR